MPIEKRLCGHDHAVDAIAALGRLLINERLLDQVRVLGRAEPFERRDPGVRRRNHWHDTGANRPTIHDHGARPTLGGPAAKLGPIQL
jgi:hypothetical protein